MLLVFDSDSSSSTEPVAGSRLPHFAAVDPIDVLIEQAAQFRLIDAAFDDVRDGERFSFNGLCDEVALRVARRFDDGTMPYEDADAVMNVLWLVMTTRAAEEPRLGLAETAFEIYEAFDAGEYDHRDGRDPVAAFTRPLIRDIVGRST